MTQGFFSLTDATIGLLLGLAIWWQISAWKRRIPFCRESRHEVGLSGVAVFLLAFMIFARWANQQAGQ